MDLGDDDRHRPRGRGLLVLAAGLAGVGLAIALAVPSLGPDEAGSSRALGAATEPAPTTAPGLPAPGGPAPATTAPDRAAAGSVPSSAPAPSSPAAASATAAPSAAPSASPTGEVEAPATPAEAAPEAESGTGSAFTTLATGAVIPRTAFGVHPGYTTPGVPAGSWRLWDTGTDWCTLQPKSGRDWRTKWLDEALARAKSAGVRDLVVVLGCTPSWAQRAPRNAAERAAAKLDLKGPNTSAPPRTTALFSAYVKKLAGYIKPRAAKGTAVWFAVWNEASLSSFWRGTPAEMAGLTAAARTAVRSVSSSYRVVAASTTLRQDRSYAKFWRPYLKALRAKGWPIDAFAIHTYPPSTGTPASRRALISRALADLRAERAPSRPVWDTELNFGLAGPGARFPFRPKDEATSAAWLSRAYLDSVRLGLGRLYWYAWSPKGNLLGITLYDGTRATDAFRTTAGWVAGSTYRGQVVSGDLVRLSFARSGKAFTIAWSESTSKPMKVPAGATRMCPADGGACVAVRPGATVRVGALPQRFGA